MYLPTTHKNVGTLFDSLLQGASMHTDFVISKKTFCMQSFLMFLFLGKLEHKLFDRHGGSGVNASVALQCTVV